MKALQGRAVLAVSPHLDDAAFSAGGMLWQIAQTGTRVVVVTVFTATVPDPQGFALACQLDKGLGQEIDYMALRRAEDAAAMDILGAEPRHLGLAEAPHRGYDSAPALFGPMLPADDAVPGICAGLTAVTQDLDIGLVLGPQGLGGHVDHRHVRDAVGSWAGERGLPLGLWRDAPYVLRNPEPSTGPERAVLLTERAVQAKSAACQAYASQLGFQFGGPEAVPAAVRELAATDGRRLGVGGVGLAESVSGLRPDSAVLAHGGADDDRPGGVQ